MINKESSKWAIIFTALPVAASAIYFCLNTKSRVVKKKKLIEDLDADADSQDFPVEPLFSVPNSWSVQGFDRPVVIVMVGLPARGKSYIVKMLRRYLNWCAYETEIFNVGSYRRKIGLAGADASFFDMTNKDSQRIREDMAVAVQDELYSWLQSGTHGRIAIFDATNTTRNRRQALTDRAVREGATLLFVESICDDETVLLRNYKMKLQNEDYKGMEPSAALADFMERVRAYEKVYEPVDDVESGGSICYIKLINVGQKIVARNCTGFLPSQVAFYLHNIHIEPRRIFLSLLFDGVGGCAAENDDDTSLHRSSSSTSTWSITSAGGGGGGWLSSSQPPSPRRSQGNHQPSTAGEQYVSGLPAYLLRMRDQMEAEGVPEEGRQIVVLTGTSQAHQRTVEGLSASFPCFATPLLDELNGGSLHGISSEDIKSDYPHIFEARKKNKLTYRYPGVGGESYIDVIERLKPIIIELERQRRTVVLVCHRAVLRCIYAYFMGTPMVAVPDLPIAIHTLYSLSPGAFGCRCEEVDVSAEMSKNV